MLNFKSYLKEKHFKKQTGNMNLFKKKKKTNFIIYCHNYSKFKLQNKLFIKNIFKQISTNYE